MRKFLWIVALLLSGCALPSKAPLPAAEPAPAVEAAPYENWQVTASQLEVRVFRDGPMAKLGHNHLITSKGLDGRIEVRKPLTKTGILLTLPLASLVVDDPAARASGGEDFVGQVPDKDRESTAHNMLGKAVLDATQQPVLKLTVDGLEGGPQEFRARLRVGLRGEERVITVPLTAKFEGNRLEIRTSVNLRHADLGLKPFNVGLGALRVRDDFQIDCRIEARRTS